MTADGKMIPPSGMREAFEKYLEMAPNGPNVPGAKGMMDAMQAGVQTEYKNPNAPASKKAAPKKK